jgi:hypothetical protein
MGFVGHPWLRQRVYERLKLAVKHNHIAANIQGKHDMKDPLAEKASNPKGLETPVKQPYAKPVLRVHGSVKNLTRGNNGSGTDRSNRRRRSDRNVKENLVRIGDHPLGIGLYLFDYKPDYRETWGQGRQFGVMAQEVETVMPEAVSMHPDGYKLVDYAMLGISLKAKI